MRWFMILNAFKRSRKITSRPYLLSNRVGIFDCIQSVLVSGYLFDPTPKCVSFRNEFCSRWNKILSWTKRSMTLKQIEVRLICLQLMLSCLVPFFKMNFTVADFHWAVIVVVYRVLVKKLATRPTIIGASIFSSCVSIPSGPADLGAESWFR